MEQKKYVYWENDEMWLGYFEEYPDYLTQGETKEELEDNLRDIYLRKFPNPFPDTGRSMSI